MTEDNKKIIVVGAKVSEKIPVHMKAALAASGIEIMIRESSPAVLETAEELTLEMPVEVHDVSNFLEDDKRKQDEKSRLVAKYAPRTIGKPSKAKVNYIKGKRYGR